MTLAFARSDAGSIPLVRNLVLRFAAIALARHECDPLERRGPQALAGNLTVAVVLALLERRSLGLFGLGGSR
jgi:hypothetical protein